MTPPPVSMSYSRPGLREVSLLLVGAAFTSLMFDQPELAVICGVVSLLVWAIAMVRGPRPSWTASASIGAGLVVTYMWWPAEGWSTAAISLMWIGAALAVFALARGYRERSLQTAHTESA